MADEHRLGRVERVGVWVAVAAASVGLVLQALTLTSQVATLRPEIENANAVAEQTARDTERIALEAQQLEDELEASLPSLQAEILRLQIEEQQPSLRVSYVTIDAYELLAYIAALDARTEGAHRPAEFPIAEVVVVDRHGNPVWDVFTSLFDEYQYGDRPEICDSYVPHPGVFDSAQASYVAQSLAGTPCAGGMESVEFLVLESVGGADVEQAIAVGSLSSFDDLIVPHWYPQECGTLYPGEVAVPFLGAEARLASAAPERIADHEVPIGALPVDSVAMIPLAITTKIGVELGPRLTFDELTILDAGNGEVETVEVRERFVGGFSSVENLNSSVAAMGC